MKQRRNKRTGMKLTMVDSYDDISDEDLVELRAQNIDLDDWNYMIFAPKSSCYSFIETIEGEDVTAWKPFSPHLESLLTGNYENIWRGDVMFRGVKKSLGISYH